MHHVGMSDTTLPTVYADESSSTGENLIDPDQPVFVAAAVHVDQGVAARIVESVQSQLPSSCGEPKYSSLTGSRRGRAALLIGLEQLPDDAVFGYVAHKRYMIVAKMVDLLIVEFMNSEGYDMYADGSALGLANLMYQIGPVLGDPAAFDKMLATFVDALRPRKPATVSDLLNSIDAYVGTAKDPGWQENLSLLQAAGDEAVRAATLNADGEARDGLDPAIPCLVQLCFEIGERIGRFNLVHDNSNTLARHALRLMSLDQLPRLTPALDNPPLPVDSIDFADSRIFPQLQVADWAAGAIRQVYSAKVNNDENDYLASLGPLCNSWMLGGIWPDVDAIGKPRPPAR